MKKYFKSINLEVMLVIIIKISLRYIPSIAFLNWSCNIYIYTRGDPNGMERASNTFTLRNLIPEPMILVSWILMIWLVPIIDRIILFYLFWEKYIGDSTFYNVLTAHAHAKWAEGAHWYVLEDLWSGRPVIWVSGRP